MQEPRVSVIIATYNWSSVLRYAITSALAQSLGDLELLVIGDCCTDNSEAVVASFGDPRVLWHNLPENCGSQFGPNNKGLKLARGRYVAYLGHDDLWHPDHLAVLVQAIERHEADLVFSLTEDIGPPSMPTRSILGLCPRGVYEWSFWAPPTSWLHRRDLVERIGPWKDYRGLVVPTDVDFLTRAFEQGCRIVPVEELTAFKFPSIARTNSYVERRSDEQAQWWERLKSEPDLRYRELIAILRALAKQNPELVHRFDLPSRAKPGSLTAMFRTRRGLDPVPRRSTKEPEGVPLFTDRATLRYLNADDDIGPAGDRRALTEGADLPNDGLFIGLNWHSLETDLDGKRWRWIDSDAQIVVTRPSGMRRRLVVDLVRGPGIRSRSARIQLRDAEQTVVAETMMRKSGAVAFDLPLMAEPGAVFTLCTENGGRTIRGDPRVLNFRVFGFHWDEGKKVSWLRRLIGRRHQPRPRSNE
ncbi:MAG TPA: glycosyltransferase family A protein [Xanthobacteraceae bacterium]|jgi:glycosyltransferase involved in cell wall biosynthesis